MSNHTLLLGIVQGTGHVCCTAAHNLMLLEWMLQELSRRRRAVVDYREKNLGVASDSDDDGRRKRGLKRPADGAYEADHSDGDDLEVKKHRHKKVCLVGTCRPLLTVQHA